MQAGDTGEGQVHTQHVSACAKHMTHSRQNCRPQKTACVIYSVRSTA